MAINSSKNAEQLSPNVVVGLLNFMPTTCQYANRKCAQKPLENFAYCIRHILEDKCAPYKQCSFIHSKTGKRCHNAALRDNIKKDCFCGEHSKKSYTVGSRNSGVARRVGGGSSTSSGSSCSSGGGGGTGAHNKAESAGILLAQLAHYAPLPAGSPAHGDEAEAQGFMQTGQSGTNASSSRRACKPQQGGVSTSPGTTHFSRGRSRLFKMTDYLTDSSSDEEEVSLLQHAWRSELESDPESDLGEDDEDSLRTAGMYTEQEVLQSTRNKMIRLQSLYIAQFKRLGHTLKDTRRQYLALVRQESEEGVEPLCLRPDMSPEDREQLKTLKAMKNYHRRTGQQLLLYRQNLARRRALTGDFGPPPPIGSAGGRHGSHTSSTVPTPPRCSFSRHGERCGDRALSCTKHCLKHMIHDPRQRLFTVCQESGCHKVVPRIQKDRLCVLHTRLKPFHTQRVTSLRDPLRQQDEIKINVDDSTGEGSGTDLLTVAAEISQSRDYLLVRADPPHRPTIKKTRACTSKTIGCRYKARTIGLLRKRKCDFWFY